MENSTSMTKPSMCICQSQAGRFIDTKWFEIDSDGAFLYTSIPSLRTFLKIPIGTNQLEN